MDISGYIDGLGDAVELGLVKAVGVSNYTGTFLVLLHAWLLTWLKIWMKFEF